MLEYSLFYFRYIFQAERWLAVEKEDGTLECVVPVSQRNDLNVFKNRLVANAKDSLADNHVWVSIVYRPSSSSFTRVSLFKFQNDEHLIEIKICQN